MKDLSRKRAEAMNLTCWSKYSKYKPTDGKTEELQLLPVNPCSAEYLSMMADFTIKLIFFLSVTKQEMLIKIAFYLIKIGHNLCVSFLIGLF